MKQGMDNSASALDSLLSRFGDSADVPGPECLSAAKRAAATREEVSAIDAQRRKASHSCHCFQSFDGAFRALLWLDRCGRRDFIVAVVLVAHRSAFHASPALHRHTATQLPLRMTAVPPRCPSARLPNEVSGGRYVLAEPTARSRLLLSYGFCNRTGLGPTAMAGMSALPVAKMTPISG